MLQIQNWKNWCRLCGREEGTEIDIFSEFQNTSIADIILKKISVQMTSSHDEPQKICDFCSKYVRELKIFSDQCIKVQKMFQELQEMRLDLVLDIVAFRKKYGLTSSCAKATKSQEQVKFLSSSKSLKCDALEAQSNDNLCYQLKQEIKSNRSSDTENNIEPQHNIKADTSKIKTKVSSKKSVACHICEKVFRNEGGLTLHLKVKHSFTKNTAFNCKNCSKVFKHKHSLLKHENSHLDEDNRKWYPCEICGKVYISESGQKLHQQIKHKKESFICDECGAVFPAKSYLNEHKISHFKENTYQCPLCPAKLKRRQYLRRHMQAHGEKYVCPECGMQLSTRNTLNAHMAVHSEERNFKCNLCDKNFKLKKTLKSHLIIHTGLKPYQCNFCSQQFLHFSTFIAHKRKSHPKEFSFSNKPGEKQISSDLPKPTELMRMNQVVEKKNKNN